MRRNQGSTLIVTMVVLAGLAACLAALSESENVAAKEAINRVERAKARQAYLDGVQNAMSILSQIVEPGGQQNSANSLTATNTSAASSNNNTTGATMTTDDWAQEGTNGDVLYHVGDHKFRMQIVDACSFININCTTSTGAGVNAACNTSGTTVPVAQAQPIGASDAVLNNLPFQPQEIQSIEDYRSSTTTQQALGAKDPYYQALQTPYNAKELPFETFDELLQVQGLTAKLLYYPRTDVSTATNPLVDTNGNNISLAQALTAYSLSPQATPTGTTMTSVGGNGNISVVTLTRAGIRQAVANSLVNKPAGGWQSMGQLIQTANRVGANTSDLKAIMNSLRVSTAAAAAQPPQTQATSTLTQNFPTVNGLININTAPVSVLEQLPGITPTIAQAIYSYAQSTGFATVGDITAVGGVTAANLAQFADQITATSQTFIVRVIGIAGSTSIPVEAVISVTNDNPQIISIQEEPFSAKQMIDRWTWDEDTTTDTVLKDNS